MVEKVENEKYLFILLKSNMNKKLDKIILFLFKKEILKVLKFGIILGFNLKW